MVGCNWRVWVGILGLIQGPLGASAGAAELFRDNFDLAGTRLDLTKWTTEFGGPSYVGRTQLRDWVTPGGIGKFTVANGQASLGLDTFNPTNIYTTSLYGTHAKTLASFVPTAGVDIALSVRMRLTSLQPGLVFGIYFYGCDAGPCATAHDELDFELVTNFLQPGSSPLRVQLNRYAAEPLGAGHGPIVALPTGFDPLAYHDWTIVWGRSKVTYSVDGVQLFSATDFIPRGSMRANLIAWGPDGGWPDGYHPSLQPVASAAYDQTFTALVDAVSVQSVPHNPRDLNADGKSDILWQNTSTGERYVWFMDGASLQGNAYIATVPTDWTIAGTADFDADGKSDILWQNTVSGDVYLWSMDGSTLKSSLYVATVLPTAWRIAGTADFDGDGKPDILWQNTSSGERYLWLMNGTTLKLSVSIGVVPPNWQIVGTGDFDGDGKPDILWQNTGGGEVYVWFMNVTSLRSSAYITTLPAVWQVAGAGDFDADGKPDILWQNTSTGERYVWLMNGTTLRSSTYIATIAPIWAIAR